ncbi:MAG: TonB-dependent siderophore receptor [Cyanophyceae cyanobacterium]
MANSVSGLNLLVLLSMTGGLMSAAEVAWAGQLSPPEPLADANSTTQSDSSVTSVPTDWFAQGEVSLVQITNIRVESTPAGLQVVLETDGQLAPPTQSVSGNALILELADAALAEQFEAFEPVEGIALVQASALPGDVVQISITGRDAVPVVEVSTETTGTVVAVAPGIPQEGAEEDAIELRVTGEEEGYTVSNTTTGTRTDTPLRDIPQSIQVIPREVLDDQQVFRLEDALRNVSGVTPSGNDPRGPRFNVRGFNDTPVLRDGFRLIRSAENLLPQELANIERIEVLKGPASIVFGAVEPGGVINLVTEQPLSEPFYEVGVRVGNRELIEPSLDISGPLTADGRLLYRLNALYRSEDSFRDFDVKRERFFIAPVVSWQISDRTDITFNFEYIDDENPGDFGLRAIGDGVADIPFDRNLNEPDDIVTSEYLRAGYRFEHRFSDRWKFRNAFNYTNRRETYTGVNGTSLDETTGDLSRNFQRFELESDIYELQTNVVGEFSTGSIDHTLLFGFDLYRRERPISAGIDFATNVPLNIFNPRYRQIPRPDFDSLPVVFDNDARLDFLGIYLQDQISFSDKFKLLAGIRYETFEQETVNNPSASSPSRTKVNQSGSSFSPRIGLVYQPVEDISLFASYSRSFAPNPASTFSEDFFDPEEGEQFEAGVKADFLDGKLSANLAYFDITLQNVVTANPLDPTLFVISGEERSRGIELDVAGEILPGWNIVANYAYIDARITEDNNGNEGNRRFNVPKHNFNLWTTYEIQKGPLEGLQFGVGFNYVGERFGDNANTFEVDSYFLTNAAISYSRNNWNAGVNIRNLFDVDYINTTSGGRASIYPGEDFTIVGSFSIEF